MTVSFITSLNSAAAMAEYGLSLIGIYCLIVLLFLLPSALISAELVAGWCEDGGVYVWVREAFGEKWGFVAVWLQWVQCVIWFPAILQFIWERLIHGYQRPPAGC